MKLIPRASTMSSHLGLVAAGAHVAPPSSPGRGAIDEEIPAAGVGADAQPRRRVIGQELGERAGDGGPCLVEPIADLGEGVSGPIRIALDLVVVEAVAEDVVEVAQLLGCRVPRLCHLGGDVVQELAQVVEPFNPPSRLIRVASQMSGFNCQTTPTDQASFAEPRQKRGDVGDGIHGLAALVFERVSEGDEELLGLVGLGKRRRIASHVTIVHGLTSYFDPRTVPL